MGKYDDERMERGETMIFFATEEELVAKLRKEDTCEEEQHCSDEWIVKNLKNGL